MFWVGILRMGGEECDRQAERFVLRALGEEVERIVLILLGDVDPFTVLVFDPVPTVIGAAEVELLGGKFSVMPFANVADPIPIVAKEAGDGFFPRSFERLDSNAPGCFRNSENTRVFPRVQSPAQPIQRLPVAAIPVSPQHSGKARSHRHAPSPVVSVPWTMLLLPASPVPQR